MFTRLHPTYKGILLALLGYSAFACGDAGFKFLSGHYSISRVLVIENICACLLLLAASPRLGGTKGIFQRENLKINALRTGLNLIVSLLVGYSFRELPMTTAYPMFFTIPFFAALWAIPVYRESLPANRIAAILLGFAGVLTATRPGTGNFDINMLVPLCAAAFIAVMFLCSKSLKNQTLFMLAFPPYAGVGLMLLPFALASGGAIPTAFHLAVFAATAACSVTGFIAVSFAFRIAAAAAVSPMMYIQMLWGIVFGLLVFGDTPDTWTLAGALIIILSGIYLVETERRNFVR